MGSLARDSSILLAYLIQNQHEWQPWTFMNGNGSGNGAKPVKVTLIGIEGEMLVLPKEI